MEVRKVTQSDIDHEERNQAGLESSESEDMTVAFEMDGLKSSLMGMLPGQVDGRRR